MKENITLRFKEDGHFRILMVSDIQETLDYDRRALDGLFAMIKAEKPDLVILGGDNLDGRKVRTHEEVSEYLKIFSRPMEETKTPWMHIYGNHDHDTLISADEQSDIYESYAHCVSGRSPEGVPGVSNYVKHILAHDSDKVAYCVYAFDTHHKNPVFRGGVTVEDLMIPHRPKPSRKWDFVRFEQQMWYWNHSKELEAKEGKLVPSMAVMHVTPYETHYATKAPELTQAKGLYEESMQCGVLNSGLYATMLQRGDIEIIAAGHSHEVTLDAIYGGIRLCLDGCAGFTPYGIDELRGGRIFDLYEGKPTETHMIAIKDYMDISK